MNTEQKLLKERLEREGYFATKGRLELFAALQQDVAPSIANLIKQLSDQNQATIYRNLNLFKRLGVIQIADLGWKSRVRLGGPFIHHHHYLRCTDCQTIIRLPENPKLEKYLHNAASRRNFINADHQVEITGLCASCQQK